MSVNHALSSKSHQSSELAFLMSQTQYIHSLGLIGTCFVNCRELGVKCHGRADESPALRQGFLVSLPASSTYELLGPNLSGPDSSSEKEVSESLSLISSSSSFSEMP